MHINMKGILLFCFAMYFVQFSKLKAQTTYQLPPNQPEQDACHALQLCGNSFSTPYSYTGTGKQLDLDETPCWNQPGGGEKNSVWLQVQVASAGTIVFTIAPVNADDDYDFAVVNITGRSCTALTADEVVRCNYNNNLPGSNKNGVIGLTDTARNPYVQNGTFGNSFGQPVFAKTGEVFLIMINNYGNYVSGGPSKGFTIDFTGSSSVFYNTANPQLNSVDVPCTNPNSITVKTNAPVLCSSIAADGSDFISNAPANIIGATGVNCTGRGGYTNSVIVTFSSPLPAGNYTINAKKGSDNNTILGLCNNELIPSGDIPFIVTANGKVTIDDETICYQQLPYAWNGIVVNSGGNGVASFTSKAAAGCDSTTLLNLNVSQAPQQISTSASICDGDYYTLPWDTAVTTSGTYTHHYTNTNGCDSLVSSVAINVFVPAGGNVRARDSTIETGFCKDGSVLLQTQNNFVSYLWNTGETSTSIVVDIAGAYSLIAKDAQGCATIDTFVVARYTYPTTNFIRFENLCTDSTIVLDAGASSSYYLWNDGSSGETITTNKPGTFWVMLTTAHNCTASDTVTVVTVQRPGNFLIPSITKCPYQTVTLTSVNSFNEYTWSNGSRTNNTTVTKGGLYLLTVTDGNGCTGRDSIRIIDSTCYEYFSMPTAFTPNNDNHNDIFKPGFAGPLSGYHLSIYNRWGKLVFSSSDPETGWDGAVQGSPQDVGTYIWICSYHLLGKSYTDKGIVTLLR